jgi:lipid A 3-O-deacylase
MATKRCIKKVTRSYKQISISSTKRLLLIAKLSLLTLTTQPVFAQSSCDKSHNPISNAAVTLRVDNDMFGWRGQDQGYSNGLQVTFTSANIKDYQDDPCLPRIARAVNHYLDWLQEDGYPQRNMVFSISQGLYTPQDRYRRDLITDDRPYAGILLASIGYNARQGNNLRSSQLRFGVVGPLSMGFQVQNAWHKMLGIDQFKGWDNQLNNEPVVQLVHERMHREANETVLAKNRWGQDLIYHWGGAVGNLASYLNAGAEWRFGWRLPDDFGSSPLRPAGENTAPPQSIKAGNAWASHLFVTVDARMVLNNITLDGNTFAESHHVNKRSFVADVGYGLVITKGLWKLAFARYHRTREFDTQKDLPVFGSVTISKQFD